MMTLVVLGIDALDPELAVPNKHPNLTLNTHRQIDTILSSTGEPSTHELWPTIITGLPPEEHGLVLDDGVAWDNPFLTHGSQIASYFLPERVRSVLGAWLLDNTSQDAFRTPATYYEKRGLETIFDDCDSLAIGIPNYVVDETIEDREQALRRQLGDLFKRDSDAVGGHTSSDPYAFYERCMEMAMIRIARVRRALRSRQYEFVFGYTSGLDLIGHIAYDLPDLQRRAYDELDTFIAELASDLIEDDVLVIVSDHGLQHGVHTDEAMISSTSPEVISTVGSVLDIRAALERELDIRDHQPTDIEEIDTDGTSTDGQAVKEQLEDLGYM